VLHREKQALYRGLLAERGAELQPGAASLLAALAIGDAPFAVVTNSTREQRHLLAGRLPELAAVRHWVTREDYLQAKPQPDAYLAALALFSIEPRRAVGVEDTPRGIEALVRAGIPAILVTETAYPDEAIRLAGVRRDATLPDLLPDLCAPPADARGPAGRAMAGAPSGTR